MHVFMSSTINLVFGMFVLSINAKKYKNIYIYIADASADASLPRFLENDASAASLPLRLPLRATLVWMAHLELQSKPRFAIGVRKILCLDCQWSIHRLYTNFTAA